MKQQKRNKEIKMANKYFSNFGARAKAHANYKERLKQSEKATRSDSVKEAAERMLINDLNNISKPTESQIKKYKEKFNK